MRECPNCGRVRVDEDGVCGKCLWDIEGGDYAAVTRPERWDTLGRILHVRGNDPFGGPPTCTCGRPWPCEFADSGAAEGDA